MQGYRIKFIALQNEETHPFEKVYSIQQDL